MKKANRLCSLGCEGERSTTENQFGSRRTDRKREPVLQHDATSDDANIPVTVRCFLREAGFYCLLPSIGCPIRTPERFTENVQAFKLHEDFNKHN